METLILWVTFLISDFTIRPGAEADTLPTEVSAHPTWVQGAEREGEPAPAVVIESGAGLNG